MDTGGPPGFGVCAAVDVLYLATGGARPTAVLAADAAFAQVMGRTHRDGIPGAALPAG